MRLLRQSHRSHQISITCSRIRRRKNSFYYRKYFRNKPQCGSVTRSSIISNASNLSLTNIRVSKPVALQPESQTFVIDNTEKVLCIVVEPKKELFDRNMCLVGTVMEPVSRNTDFQILIINVGKHPKTFTWANRFIPGRTSNFNNGVLNN